MICWAYYVAAEMIAHLDAKDIDHTLFHYEATKLDENINRMYHDFHVRFMFGTGI